MPEWFFLVIFFSMWTSTTYDDRVELSLNAYFIFLYVLFFISRFLVEFNWIVLLQSIL
jgi:hypothetical protein